MSRLAAHFALSGSIIAGAMVIYLHLVATVTGSIHPHLVAHDVLELARAELAVGVAEFAVARDAREVRRRHVDPRCKVLRRAGVPAYRAGEPGEGWGGQKCSTAGNEVQKSRMQDGARFGCSMGCAMTEWVAAMAEWVAL